MAKRLTDTAKWNDEWFGSLCNDHRIIWQYLVDNCSFAGIWKRDFRGLNFNCNTNITEEQFQEIFKERVVYSSGYYFIPKFIKFQYSSGLQSNKPVIISVRKELIKHGLHELIGKSLGNDYAIIKESLDNDCRIIKDKYKDNNIVNNKKKVVEGKPKPENPIPSIEDFLAYCKTVLVTEYPKFEFSLKAKYDAWHEAGWKDGNMNKIKNWKTKIKNTIPYLRATSIPTLITDIKQHPNYDKHLEHDTHIKTVSNIPLEPKNIEYLKRTGRG